MGGPVFAIVYLVEQAKRQAAWLAWRIDYGAAGVEASRFRFAPVVDG